MTLSFVARSGCDSVLLAFVAACEKAGFCKSVGTGAYAYPQ